MSGQQRGTGELWEGPGREGAQPSRLSVVWAPVGFVIRPGAQEPGLGWRWEWETLDGLMVHKAG